MIVYYITSHGFGHAVRSCEVIRNLPSEIPLTLRTAVPEWFLRHELNGRSFEIAPAEFDCGVLGPDSARVDLAATTTRMEELLRENEARLDDEIAYLRRLGTRLVLADVPSFPLRIAREAAIPSILIANFTWPAIYWHMAEFCDGDETLKARARAVIDAMQREYDLGDLLLATDMQIPMRACRARIETPMIARRGTNRRRELVEKLGLDPARKLALLYLGRDGMEGIAWERLKEYRDLQIVSYAVPSGAEAWIHPLPEGLIDHIDAAATAEVTIAKPGYGICGECIAAGTPLIYTPRPEFAEMQAVEALMQRWGGGIPIGEEDFRALNWRPYLDRLTKVRIRPGAVDCSGGSFCARIVEDAWRRGLSHLPKN